MDTENWKLKRVICNLKSQSGDGTSMITLLIPPYDPISKFTKIICSEKSSCTQIKDRTNRQSVESALKSVEAKLKLYKATPPCGLCIFCGNVNGKLVCLDYVPPKPISVSMYNCGKNFELEHLESLTVEKDSYGIIVICGDGCLFATIQGNKVNILHDIKVDLPRKHNKGGQSAVRFERIRRESSHNYITKCCELSVRFFIDQSSSKPNISKLIIGGVADFKNKLVGCGVFDPRLGGIVGGIIDVAYGGKAGLDQVVNSSSGLFSGFEFEKERLILQELFNEILLGSDKYAFSYESCKEAIDSGLARVLIISDDIDNSIIDYFVELCPTKGCDIKIVGTVTQEGTQFHKGFGGIACILRYNVDIFDDVGGDVVEDSDDYTW